jgi:predicted metal-dependent hydrolase
MPDTTPGQLDLFSSHTEAMLKEHLEHCLGRRLDLVLTENSTAMLSARMRNGLFHVRLHRMFLASPEPVMREIVIFLKQRKGPMPRFRQFVRDQGAHMSKRPPNKVRVRTRGKVHDLAELFQEINKEYFDGAVCAPITWGAGSSRYAVRRRTLGSFSARSNAIRINPLLDKKSVPRYFIAFIVYHEMLHAALGTPLKGKRRSIHSREFRQRERLFRDFERAMAWERGEKNA